MTSGTWAASVRSGPWCQRASHGGARAKASREAVTSLAGPGRGRRRAELLSQLLDERAKLADRPGLPGTGMLEALDFGEEQRRQHVILHRFGLPVAAIGNKPGQHLGHFAAIRPYWNGVLPSAYGCL